MCACVHACVHACARTHRLFATSFMYILMQTLKTFFYSVTCLVVYFFIMSKDESMADKLKSTFAVSCKVVTD